MPIYTPELGTAICDELVLGDTSLRAIARKLKISHSLILKWAKDIPEFRDQYARACEIGDDAAFDKLIDESREEPERVTVSIGENATKTSVDSGWVNWKRNQLDLMKWVLARKRPKKYGDKVDLNHGGSIDLGLADVIAKARDRAK